MSVSCWHQHRSSSAYLTWYFAQRLFSQDSKIYSLLLPAISERCGRWLAAFEKRVFWNKRLEKIQTNSQPFPKIKRHSNGALRYKSLPASKHPLKNVWNELATHTPLWSAACVRWSCSSGCTWLWLPQVRQAKQSQDGRSRNVGLVLITYKI